MVADLVLEREAYMKLQSSTITSRENRNKKVLKKKASKKRASKRSRVSTKSTTSKKSKVRKPKKAKQLLRAHPHSVYLYVLACTGAIGGLFLLAVIVSLIRQCWRDPPNHLYADGAFIVLIGWLIGAGFDCYNLNGHMFGLVTMVVAVTLPGRAAASNDSGSDTQAAVA